MKECEGLKELSEIIKDMEPLNYKYRPYMHPKDIKKSEELELRILCATNKGYFNPECRHVH